MPQIERRLLVVQPIVFATAVILARFVEQPSASSALVRPLLVAALAATVLILVLYVANRSAVWTAITADFLVLFLLREAAIAAVFAAILVWWAMVRVIRQSSNRPRPPMRIPNFAARSGAYFSLAYLAVMGWSAYQVTTVMPAPTQQPEIAVTGAGGPNIYLIMLDGYPRADTSEDLLEFDNSSFEDALLHRGFDIANGARSNYNKTWLTLASMLNGAYVADLLGDQPIPPDDQTHIRWLYALINDARMLEAVRERGYSVATIPAPITTTSLSSADEYIDHGHLTELEAKIIWSSPVAQLFADQLATALFANQRGLIEDSLETAAELAESSTPQPRFLLAEVHSPHPPFALAELDPGEPPMPDCFPEKCSLWQATIEELAISFDEYRSRMVLQLTALNLLVLDAVDRIIAADPEAVVILWSDHGLRYSLADPNEHFRSFLAARTPGFDGLFPEDESPVNLLRRLFSAYFDADLPPLPYRAWFSNWDFTLQLTPVDP